MNEHLIIYSEQKKNIKNNPVYAAISLKKYLYISTEKGKIKRKRREKQFAHKKNYKFSFTTFFSLQNIKFYFSVSNTVNKNKKFS